MELFSKNLCDQLFEHGDDPDNDHPPVVRLFMTNTQCTWLISELYKEKPGLAFGLCDLGMGFPELGFCDLDEMQEAQMPDNGVYLVCDKTFKGAFPMTAYSAAAREYRHVVTDPSVVSRYCKKPTPQ